MYTLARGGVHGAAFGLAVAGVETWFAAWHLMQSHLAPPVRLLVYGAVQDVGLGAAIGVACGYLLRLRRHGLGWHRLAVALVWAAVEVATAPAGRVSQLGALLGPVAALVLVPVARALAFKWRWDPVLLGLLLVTAAIAAAAVGAR